MCSSSSIRDGSRDSGSSPFPSPSRLLACNDRIPALKYEHMAGWDGLSQPEPAPGTGSLKMCGSIGRECAWGAHVETGAPSLGVPLDVLLGLPTIRSSARRRPGTAAALDAVGGASSSWGACGPWRTTDAQLRRLFGRGRSRWPPTSSAVAGCMTARSEPLALIEGSGG